MTGLAARRLAQLRLAIMLLSRLPVGRLRDPIPTLAEARWAYPLVGLVIGTLGWAVLQGVLMLGLPDGVAAVAMLGAMALATGGLHHDGLADFADGIGGGRDRDHALAIMKDSRIGSYGALALILGVGLAATGLASMAQTLTLGGLLLVAVASRLAMLGVLMALPPARADGLGQGTAGGSGLGAAVPGAVIALALCVLLGGAGWAALAVMAATAMAVAGSAKTRLGGQTGDVLGAVQILCETAGWIALAAALA